MNVSLKELFPKMEKWLTACIIETKKLQSKYWGKMLNQGFL